LMRSAEGAGVAPRGAGEAAMERGVTGGEGGAPVDGQVDGSEDAECCEGRWGSGRWPILEEEVRNTLCACEAG
jgi:hypothetical protein